MGQEVYSIRDVLDQVRTLLTRAHAWYGQNIEPLEKLPEALEAASRILDRDLPAGKQELENLTKFLTDLRAKMPDVEAQVRQATARVTAATGEAAAAEHASQEQIGVAERLASARDIQLTREFEHKGATLQRDHEVRRDELAAEIMALEAKKAALDSAIAALRAKHFA